jgi:hypothetical protein
MVFGAELAHAVIPLQAANHAEEIVFDAKFSRWHTLLFLQTGYAHCINSIQGTPIARKAAKKITPKIAPSRQ